MENGGGDLPQELVYRILVLLPVKSLIRFTCVCRLWHDVILRDPYFARDQLVAARELRLKQPSLSHKRLLFSTPNQVRVFHVLESPEEEEEAEIETQSFELDGSVTLLGSCNGFVFFTPNEGGEWVRIRNPVRPDNHNSWILPDPEFDLAVLTRPVSFRIDWNKFSGAGYVPATGDYKLLIAHGIYSVGDDDFEVTEVRLYSLKSNSWKSIDWSDCIECYGISTVFRDGLLHWIDYNDNTIAVFDLGNEEFQSLSLPYFQGISLSSLELQLGVSAAQGCLTLASLFKHHLVSGDSFMKFWMMKEYGVAQSWTMLYRIIFSSPGSKSWFVNLVVMETCTVATVATDKNQYQRRYRLIRINHKQEEREKQLRLFDAGESFDRPYSMLEYEESLISLE